MTGKNLNPLAWLLIKTIKLYQKTLSPDHSVFFKHRHPIGFCKFQPTCSDYTIIAIEKYGVFKGTFKGFKRVARCNPWNKKGGYDYP